MSKDSLSVIEFLLVINNINVNKNITRYFFYMPTIVTIIATDIIYIVFFNNIHCIDKGIPTITNSHVCVCEREKQREGG